LILSVNVELPEHDPGVMIDRGEQMMGRDTGGCGHRAGLAVHRDHPSPTAYHAAAARATAQRLWIQVLITTSSRRRPPTGTMQQIMDSHGRPAPLPSTAAAAAGRSWAHR
jgi:hypothetical protein